MELEITLKPSLKDYINIKDIRIARDNNAIIIVIPNFSCSPDVGFCLLSKSDWESQLETKKRVE